MAWSERGAGLTGGDWISQVLVVSCHGIQERRRKSKREGTYIKQPEIVHQLLQTVPAKHEDVVSNNSQCVAESSQRKGSCHVARNDPCPLHVEAFLTSRNFPQVIERNWFFF